MTRRRAAWLALFLGWVGCGGASSNLRPADGLDAASLPENIRPDYEVFAHRCSKCHSLARPLNSGITDHDYWVRYVAKMRRQPGSNISAEDSEAVMRFLDYYSTPRPKPQADSSRAGSLSPSGNRKEWL